LLVGAGLAVGRHITTHHDFIDDLRATGGSDVVEGVRFVRDGAARQLHPQLQNVPVDESHRGLVPKAAERDSDKRHGKPPST
jgi:putative intracellular protease/amidase